MYIWSALIGFAVLVIRIFAAFAEPSAANRRRYHAPNWIFAQFISFFLSTLFLSAQ